MDVQVSSLDEVYLLHGGLLFIELQLVGSDVVVVWIPTPTDPSRAKTASRRRRRRRRRTSRSQPR